MDTHLRYQLDICQLSRDTEGYLDLRWDLLIYHNDVAIIQLENCDMRIAL